MISLMGLVFVVVGSLFAWGAIKQNTFCGVRLRWTLADEEVWDRTNCLAGELVMLWGILLVCFGCHSRMLGVKLLLWPALIISICVTIFAALLFGYRHKTYQVELPKAQGTVPTSLLLDAILLVIPVAGYLLTQKHLVHLPEQVPVQLTAHGFVAQMGKRFELLKLHYFAVFLWALLAAGARLQHTVSINVTRAYFIMRFGALLFVEALVLASALIATQRIANGWVVLALPVLLVLGGLGLLLYEAMGALPVCSTALANEVDDEEEDEEEDEALSD
jgi:uncharacterized membrane protein